MDRSNSPWDLPLRRPSHADKRRACRRALLGEEIRAALRHGVTDIRDCEREAEFGARFVELARSVYKSNDHRAALKRRINELLGSVIVEEKSYAATEPARLVQNSME